ncbi:protein that induces appearance of [PIN+] prion when overproduced [Sporothrix epigloea]|uniref:Protein that induces appearance of [PIN+] prion when overproduced n=1 Tax=Sporothrix epigloea TaxID=1892477 RepID=A0ABP0E0X2_9PEZI
MADHRQKAMDINRSLRTIKTSKELEALLEKDAITDDDFNAIHDLLPQEWSLRGGQAAAPLRQQQATPTPSTHLQPPSGPALPIRSNSNQSIASAASAASAFPLVSARALLASSTASSAASSPAPSSRRDRNSLDGDGRATVGYAAAKYAYDAPNEGDLAFEKGDTLGVLSKVNDDWWLGRNVRSGKVGIFPRQYVKPEAALADLELANQLPGPNDAPSRTSSPYSNGGSRTPSSAPPSYYDKYGNPPPQQQQQQYGGGDVKYGQPFQQPSYGQQHSYYGAGSSEQPPPQQQMQQQQDGQGNDHMKNTGKKIGGKLGNAFVTGVGFAAGAELVGAIL